MMKGGDNMSNIKTGMMYSPLTERVFWGQMNIKTGVKTGKEAKDITSDFIGVMLQKFQINTQRTITANGKIEAVIIVLDEKKSKKYLAAPDLFNALEILTAYCALEGIPTDAAQAALTKARGGNNG
jgi:hypothetical protein